MIERSFLFVPGNRPERFDKAYGAGAHAVLVDLEDAVAPAAKAEARKAARAWLTAAKPVGRRINGPESEWLGADLDLASLPAVRGIMVPQAEEPAALREVPGRAPEAWLVPLVESA